MSTTPDSGAESIVWACIHGSVESIKACVMKAHSRDLFFIALPNLIIELTGGYKEPINVTFIIKNNICIQLLKY